MLNYEEARKIVDSGDYEDRLLTDDMDHVAIWEKYIKEDNKSICGEGVDSIEKAISLNATLAEGMGVATNLPDWGLIIDIGAGYEPARKFMRKSHEYYPVDIAKRMPTTHVVKDQKVNLENECATAVICCNVFQHLTNKQRLDWMKESYRLLQVGGLMFLASSMDNSLFPPDVSGVYCKETKRRFAVTGDYLAQIPSTNDLLDWIAEVNSNAPEGPRFRILAINCRFDSFCAIWLRKM